MKTALSLSIARYVGIGAAICVPAIVVAQALPNFGANQVLRANQLQTLTTVLDDMRSRVLRLEASSGVALTKSNIYPQSNNSGSIPQNGTGLAQASCEDENDILVGCSCEGQQDGVNSLQFDLRRVTASNRLDGESTCVCQGVNVGTNAARVLIATAQCLEIP
jgi:hypothetical protein